MKIISLVSINGGYVVVYTKDVRQYNRFRVAPAKHLESQIKVHPKSGITTSSTSSGDGLAPTLDF